MPNGTKFCPQCGLEVPIEVIECVCGYLFMTSCPNCGFMNPTMAPFCANCGWSFQIICDNCGTPNDPGVSPCIGCNYEICSECEESWLPPPDECPNCHQAGAY